MKWEVAGATDAIGSRAAANRAQIVPNNDLGAFSDRSWQTLHPESDGAEIAPGPRHVRLTADGRVALLGWHRARVDCPWFDLADLPVCRLGAADATVARAAAHGWEAASAWAAEPNYARWRLDLLDGYRATR